MKMLTDETHDSERRSFVNTANNPLGQTLIDVCPVPSCGRCHDEQGYFEVVDGELVRGQIAEPSKLVAATERMLKTLRARTGG